MAVPFKSGSLYFPAGKRICQPGDRYSLVRADVAYLQARAFRQAADNILRPQPEICMEGKRKTVVDADEVVCHAAAAADERNSAGSPVSDEGRRPLERKLGVGKILVVAEKF